MFFIGKKNALNLGNINQPLEVKPVLVGERGVKNCRKLFLVTLFPLQLRLYKRYFRTTRRPCLVTKWPCVSLLRFLAITPGGHTGGFHLHLLVFPFVYQFISRLEASSEGFQHHFTIISKFVCCGCYMRKNVAFTLISFAVLY